MNSTTRNISIVMALGLLLLFFAPSVVKFSHLFEHHKHETCHHPKKLHYHEVEMDCDFDKFKLNQEFHLTFISFRVGKAFFSPKLLTKEVHLAKTNTTLSYSLRGPPPFSMYT